ncbi:putative PurR-regulated permease PerM [Paenibacillus cellulosilyticus]|uniref:Putative PurR-regulated permease PerM n=1 Tax=Paenibacillus cellulosilyticus TaxID=375489 RepID=A0A2V2YAF4_9BACL|nr:AI-2E family transporter [Paenibacillus cellulosilyticus]PWV88461.1 putative PurR-regulated permease PerM [Paenibacillus cellulosilyticus]QKS44095.1 AI-2E family transporter [Paenibacillus cellulosilyticus]
MGIFRELLASPAVRKITICLIVLFAVYCLKDMLNLILLLFLVTFVMNSLTGFLTKRINRLFPIHPNVVTSLLYIVIIAAMVIGISNYVPKIIGQVTDLINNIIKFLDTNKDDKAAQQLTEAINNIDYQHYGKEALNYISKLSEWLEIILVVILLSFFFLLQKASIMKFTRKFKTSKIGWLYEEMEYFGRKFISSFGKVIEVQLIIAIVNTILTMIGLWILGFPYLVILTILVFLLSLIPVAGVAISFIPISVIAFQTGGWMLVLWAVVMILVIHAVETYVLNPRLMSHKTKLPMFYTFVILVFSQHYFGIWGLILGIPIFMFLLDILDVKTEDEKSLA